MKKDDIDKRLKDRFDYVYWAIYLYNTSLTELHIISDHEYSKSEISIVNSHPFDFYRITLLYCFIMEYNKLFDTEKKDKSKNSAALLGLNRVVFSIVGDAYKSEFEQNETALELIRQSPFFKKMRILRDKKFAHSENHEISSPFSIKGFITDDFNNGFNHLKIIKQILDSCSSQFEFSYDLKIPSRENRTRSFIEFHANYSDYYFANYMDEKEYTLKQKGFPHHL